VTASKEPLLLYHPIVILGAIAGLYLLALVFGTLRAYRLMFNPTPKSAAYTLNYALENRTFDPALLDLPWEHTTVPAAHRNADLTVSALPGSPGAVAGTLILVHGFTWTRFGMLKYAAPFIGKGWNLVGFDLGGHGDSPAGSVAAPSFGYHEKHDLAAVAAWTRSRFPGPGPLVLLGESMGAATVLQYAPQDPALAAVIADSPFSSAGAELDARLAAARIPRFLAVPIRALVSALLRRLRGYDLADASPEDAILRTRVPILFIHGAEDTYVPTGMSTSMAASRRAAGAGPTELLIVPGARHVQSVLIDPDAWFAAVFSFLQSAEVSS